MKALRVLTATEQVAAHLRKEILSGTWVDTIPGTASLAKKLGVGLRTVSDALYELEDAGLLVNQGSRRRRKILVTENGNFCELRVAILAYEESDKEAGLYTELLLKLLLSGHQAFFCDKTLVDLGMSVERVRRFVDTVSADAWIVFAAPHDVTEFFARQSVPAFAITGHAVGKNIASAATTKKGIIPEIVRRLTALGHRRIVYLSRIERHHPNLEAGEKAFLDEMVAQGTTTSQYNLPDWPSHAEGLRKCLDSLFKVTPPTAMLIDESPIFYAVQQYLGVRGITAPRNISLISADYDKGFVWQKPSIAHIAWNPRKLQQCVVNWTNKLARGTHEKRCHAVKAAFVEGGTVGPAPSSDTASRISQLSSSNCLSRLNR